MPATASREVVRKSGYRRAHGGLLMDDALLNVIMERLKRHPLAGPASALLLAALDGDVPLRERLAGEPGPPAEPGVAARATSISTPPGTYLRSVTAAGFRGVGPAATLPVEPGPGLTLVVGRNGSGKSSFAEALEVLLTGDLRRWQERPNATARDGWRNLHEPAHAEVAAEFLIEGAGLATVLRTWREGGTFSDSTLTVRASERTTQVDGERTASERSTRTDGERTASERSTPTDGEHDAALDLLGWGDALATYRPFLSHSELEAFFAEPSRVYDLLLSVLGLDTLTTAARLLADARKEREAGTKAAASRLPGLRGDLAAVDDERAAACVDALACRVPDLDRVLALTTGAVGNTLSGDLDRLRRLAELTPPPEEDLRRSVTELRAAAAEAEKHLSSQEGQARALAALLSDALDHHDAHGGTDCPVCGTRGALTAHWREQTRSAIIRLRAQAEAAETARTQAESALSHARDLITPPPAVLTGPPVAGTETRTAATEWSAWSAWSGRPDPAGLRALAEHIEHRAPPLAAALSRLRAQAQSELMRREDRWAPVAARVAAWARDCQDSRAAAAPVPALKAAENWLKNATDDVRNARLEPLADRSRAIWSLLRQESNVSLGAIRLSGSSTRRHADVEVTVDGTPGVALGVMSQGEINALALSIFIPRATLPASPFRFLIIDDPVQAMDPAKVDGLARVLHDVSRSRQVVVFTHDDRLATAIRRLEIPARVLEVTRRPGSVVEIRAATDPVDRQLKDAMALCMDPAVPADIAAYVVPGLCRTAVEAAFTEAIWRTQVRTGRPHAQIEASIAAARETKERAALAVFGDPARRNEVIGLLSMWNRGAATTFKQLNGATHIGHKGDLRSLVDRTRFLAGLIRERLS